MAYLPRYKEAAETECSRLIAELDGGSHIEPAKSTVREYFTRWLAHEKANVSPKTHQQYEKIALEEYRACHRIGDAL